MVLYWKKDQKKATLTGLADMNFNQTPNSADLDRLF